MMRRILFASLLSLCTCRGQALLTAPGVAPAAAVSPPAEPAPVAAGGEANADHPDEAAPPGLPIEPVDAAGSMSAGAVALARYGERTLAFIADADDRALVTFDVETRARMASTPLPCRPSAVLVTPAGQVAALGADDARVHLMVLTAIDAPLVARREIPVPAEPVSAAVMPGGQSLLVASRWGHALSVVPLSSGEGPTVVDLPRDPSAVMVSADGRRAVVLHAAGSRASLVDLEAGTATTTSLDRRVKRDQFPSMMPMPTQLDIEPQGQAVLVPAPKMRVEMVTLHADQTFAMVRTGDNRLLSPEVFVDTGPASASGGYGASESTVTPAVVSFDGTSGKMLDPGGDRTFGTRCLLPRGAAFDALSKRLLVACLGGDEIVVLGIEARSVRLVRLVPVPKGPVAVAVDGAAQLAVVWSPIARAVTVLGLQGDTKKIASVTLDRVAPAPSEQVVRGRALFDTAFDTRVSSDGRACASCHPDGRDDGLTWSSPNGPMQTPMLLSRLGGTAPYGWDGSAKDLAHHLAHTTSRLGGSGLSRGDVADIEAYLASLSPPESPASDASLVARGATLFRSEQTECASCHAGDALTDGDLHDVSNDPKKRATRGLDTPSLRFVAHSGPYFHDGRYATLGDLLAGSDGAMGHTSQLPSDDRAALLAYLATL